MTANPIDRPDNRQKKRAAIGLAALLIASSAVLDAAMPGLVDRFIIVYGIMLSIAVLWWMYLDAAERPLVRPNGWEIVFALLFLPLGLWLYLMRSRSALRGLGILLAIVAVAIALYGAGFYATSGVIRLAG